jgi:ribosomal protein S11
MSLEKPSGKTHIKMLRKENKGYNKKSHHKNKKVRTKNFKFYKSKKAREKKKRLLIVKKFLRYQFYRPSLQQSLFIDKLKRFLICLTIKVTSNNIFCNLRCLVKNKTLQVGSCGKYNIKVSRKKLKYVIKPIVTSFLQEAKTKIRSKNVFVVLVAPTQIRKYILKFLYSKILKNRNSVVKVKEKKCFNGCRVKKKKRKKQKGLRLLK